MSQPSSLSPPVVLLVEDEPDVREAFCLTLEDQGLTVRTAGSSEEALPLLHQEHVHLVVTDFSLPGQNGGWLLKEAQRRGLLHGDPLIVTAHSRDALGTGFTVLQKPVELDTFISAVMIRLAPLNPSRTTHYTVFFALDADASSLLTAEQRALSAAIAERAAQDLGGEAAGGVYRTVQDGLSVLYRVHSQDGALTVLEVRSAPA